MAGETLYAGTDYFRPFPQAEDVFGGDVARHAEHLLPLASVDLAHLSRDWSGWLHFVMPIEPTEGVIGAGAEAYHTHLCRENWIGYRIRGGKYEFAADFRFFAKTRLNVSTITDPTADDDDLAIHYYNIRAGYNVQRERVAKQRYLYHCWAKPGWFGYKRADRCPMVTRLGGGFAPDGNWAYCTDFPLERTGQWIDEEGTTQDKICPLTEDGRAFVFIGLVSLNEYVRPTDEYPGMDADLLLFYDPVQQLAVSTFDIS